MEHKAPPVWAITAAVLVGAALVLALATTSSTSRNVRTATANAARASTAITPSTHAHPSSNHGDAEFAEAQPVCFFLRFRRRPSNGSRLASSSSSAFRSTFLGTTRR